jgi:hypothetical protein
LRWPARQVVGSASSGCAVIGDNGLQCWGDNRFGQLARSAPEASAEAISLPMEERISTLSQNGFVGGPRCVLLESGAVRCWGYNWDGQLGFAPLLSSAVPRKIVE